jgi:hypothetical protein
MFTGMVYFDFIAKIRRKHLQVSWFFNHENPSFKPVAAISASCSAAVFFHLWGNTQD